MKNLESVFLLEKSGKKPLELEDSNRLRHECPDLITIFFLHSLIFLPNIPNTLRT